MCLAFSMSPLRAPPLHHDCGRRLANLRYMATLAAAMYGPDAGNFPRSDCRPFTVRLHSGDASHAQQTKTQGTRLTRPFKPQARLGVRARRQLGFRLGASKLMNINC